ncbi:hypothetical protein ACFVIM_34240 [Streptomyces sp. NPDC057638]|uniref:hypothetical protein n=1 Tax=Streptomyces sp. NPDC057638 TaxID=3346190 RepID=UPI0036A8B3A1
MNHASALGAFVERLDGRARLFTMSGSYGEVCAYLDGLDAATGGGTMRAFGAWINGRGVGLPEWVWWNLVLADLGTGRRSRDLASFTPEQHAEAIAHLFRLLREYLGTADPAGAGD